MSKEWTRIYAATFGKELSEAGAADIAEEIRQALPDLKRYEVIAGIRSLGRRGKTYGNPAAGEIITEIRAIRDREHHAGTAEERVNRACPYCGGTGIIDRMFHVPGLAHTEAVKCTCRNGGPGSQRVLDTLRAHGGQDGYAARYRANSEHMRVQSETWPDTPAALGRFLP